MVSLRLAFSLGLHVLRAISADFDHFPRAENYMLRGVFLANDANRSTPRNAEMAEFSPISNSILETSRSSPPSIRSPLLQSRFKFMTENFSTVSTRDKEMLDGHACNNAGNVQRVLTYYASSFCYWIPASGKDDEMSWQRGVSMWTRQHNLGVTWEVPGGEVQEGVCMLTAAEAEYKYKGKCIKCSLCHNNARTATHKPTWHYQIETVELPDCLSEEQIKELCNQEYEKSADLKARQKQLKECKKAEEDFVKAQENVALTRNRKRGALAAWRQKVRDEEGMRDDYINVVRTVERRVKYAREKWKRTKSEAQTKKQAVSPRFDARFKPQLPMEQISVQKSTESDAVWMANPDYKAQMAAYENDLAFYQVYWKTESLHADWKAAQQHLKFCKGMVSKVKRSIQWYLDTEEKRKASVLWAKARKPELEATFEAAQQAWSGMEQKCKELKAHYDDGRDAHLATCAQAKYQESCELRCLDATGCGVIEGGHPGNSLHTGGIAVKAEPPYKSWIHSLHTADGGPETLERHVARINLMEQPVYPQSLVRQGWLSRRGRAITGTHIWNRYWVVLESGDPVRAPLLRFFQKEPAKGAALEEYFFGKEVSLWDIEKVEACTWLTAHCMILHRPSALASGDEQNVALCASLSHVGAGSLAKEMRDEWAQAIASEGHVTVTQGGPYF